MYNLLYIKNIKMVDKKPILVYNKQKINKLNTKKNNGDYIFNGLNKIYYSYTKKQKISFLVNILVFSMLAYGCYWVYIIYKEHKEYQKNDNIEGYDINNNSIINERVYNSSGHNTILPYNV